jgi:DNA polymerase
MNPRAALAAHLRLYANLGVTGISKDPTWRERAAPTVGTDLPDPADAGLDTDMTHDTFDPDAMAAPEPPAATDAAAVTPRSADPAAALASLREEIGDCTRCVLHTLGRKQVVFGVGNPHAALMIVGEAPGADEDQQGEPFVGKAGQLLTKIIEAIELKRSDVYIANVIKCRPPGNRNPEPPEVATCSPFLLRQIDIIRPKVIVALGTFAAQMLLQADTPISRLRGQVHPFRGGIKLVPTFHPAYLLRSPDKKRDVWEDMKLVRGLLAEPD